MKKLFAVILSFTVALSVVGCTKTDKTSTDNSNSKTTNSTADSTSKSNGGQTAKDEVIWFENYTDNGAILNYAELPETVKCLENTVDFSDEYSVAGGFFIAMTLYESDPDTALAMLEILNGPDDVSAYDKSFIKEQFSQYPYVARSYFTGAKPENNYTPECFEIEFKENPYSRNEENYVVLHVHSGGADSDRQISLRYKPSTGEWFVNNYSGILAGIRNPVSNDKWA